MPDRCLYCYGKAEKDLPLRARRQQSAAKGTLTVTRVDELISIDVPYCLADAGHCERIRREIRVAGAAIAGLTGLIAFLAIVISLDAPLGARSVLALLAGALLGMSSLLATGILIRRAPRYRDWGAGLLGIDLAAGADRFTFRFTNATYAAAFRTRNGAAR